MTVVDTEGTQDIYGQKRFINNVPECDTDPVDDEDLVRLKYFNNNQASMPTGVVLAWVTDTAPSGYLLCDGSAISRSTYADLFAVVGTTFGVGDGSTTFNLPDLRGRVIIGQDDMGGSSANRITAAAADSIGGTGGVETHTLTINEIPSHNHNYIRYAAKGYGGSGVYPGYWRNNSSVATASTGGGAAHENTQPWIALNWVIKT